MKITENKLRNVIRSVIREVEDIGGSDPGYFYSEDQNVVKPGHRETPRQIRDIKNNYNNAFIKAITEKTSSGFANRSGQEVERAFYRLSHMSVRNHEYGELNLKIDFELIRRCVGLSERDFKYFVDIDDFYKGRHYWNSELRKMYRIYENI